MFLSTQYRDLFQLCGGLSCSYMTVPVSTKVSVCHSASTWLTSMPHCVSAGASLCTSCPTGSYTVTAGAWSWMWVPASGGMRKEREAAVEWECHGCQGLVTVGFKGVGTRRVVRSHSISQESYYKSPLYLGIWYMTHFDVWASRYPRGLSQT